MKSLLHIAEYFQRVAILFDPKNVTELRSRGVVDKGDQVAAFGEVTPKATRLAAGSWSSEPYAGCEEEPAGGMIIRNTRMSTRKVAITMDRKLLKRLDTLVSRRTFANRSRAIQEAVQDKLARLDRSRLARECAKLDPKAERILAEEGLGQDLTEWPEY